MHPRGQPIPPGPKKQNRFPVAPLLCLSLALAACGSNGSRAGSTNGAPATPVPTRVPPKPTSWLARTTLLTIYGRAFNQAPILGRLGMDGGFPEFRNQVAPLVAGMQQENGGRRVRPALHLIYALATPCVGRTRCLAYLDDTGVNIVRDYIRPAARRGWLVVLDDQLGRSWPAAEIRRIISRGYLRYDNVAVALDPEFRTAPQQDPPGIPVGSVGAGELNRAEVLVNRYALSLHPRHRKLFMIHQFQWPMIRGRVRLRTHLPYVDTVVIADGFGTPDVKANVYRELLGSGVKVRLRWRGIKLFYPNPYEQAGHADYPVMTWRQVFGLDPAIDFNGLRYYVRPAPNVIVVA